jgi:hypothetical protein
MVVAEEIRSSRPCTGAAVAGTGLREEGKEKLTCGATSPEREERERAGRGRGGWRRQAGPGWQREREREEARGVAGLREEVGRGVAHAGRGGEKGPEGKRGGLGCWAAGLSFLSLFFSFLFHTQTIQTIPFEFK